MAFGLIMLFQIKKACKLLERVEAGEDPQQLLHINTKKGLIYCRVSDTKQKTEGHGLDSQEHRCRQYAKTQGIEVEAVFPDDITGGGDFMKRPGMVALLKHLDINPLNEYVVIFDDLKRFARDLEFYFKLRHELSVRNATVECLNFKFEDTPEGEFVETVFAAQGQLERQQNRRQTIQKMKARMEQGYAVFRVPIGYRYKKTPEHGRLLVPDEPYASILKEALEGFASDLFQTQGEVKRLLENHPDFPTNGKGEIEFQRVFDLLTNPLRLVGQQVRQRKNTPIIYAFLKDVRTIESRFPVQKSKMNLKLFLDSYNPAKRCK